MGHNAGSSEEQTPRMSVDLSAIAPHTAASPLRRIPCELLSEGSGRCEELVEGCTTRKAITFRFTQHVPDLVHTDGKRGACMRRSC